MTKRLEEKLCMWSQTLLKLSFLKPNIAVFLHINTSGSCQVHNCALYSKTSHSAVILLTHLFQYGLLVCLFISQVLPTNSGFILPFITWEMFSLNAWTEVFSLPAVGRSIRQYSVQSNSGESPAIGGVFLLRQSDEIVEVNRRTASGLWVIWPCPTADTGPLSQKSEILSKTAAVIKQFSVCPSHSKTLQLQYLLWVRPTGIYNWLQAFSKYKTQTKTANWKDFKTIILTFLTCV